jgi:phosphoglycerol transferase
VQVYALKPIEFFIPPPYHRFKSFAETGQKHPQATMSVGEFPSPYLGVVGGLAFVALIGWALKGMLLGRRLGFGRYGVYSAWLIMVAMVGGGMELFQNLSGQNLFRSNNRASIYVFMFGLLFLAALLTRLAKKWPRWLLGPVLAPVLAFALYDQTAPSHIQREGGPPVPIPNCDTSQREKIAEADEKLVRAFEQRVPPGTRVFQLPPQQFPEAGPYGGLTDYEQFRPYLFAKDLRFSYGNMKGRPQASWQNGFYSKPPVQALTELQEYGFGGLYVLRKAYPPDQVTYLLAALREIGATEVLESEYGDSFFAVLHPSPTPRAPPP